MKNVFKKELSKLRKTPISATLAKAGVVKDVTTEPQYPRSKTKSSTS